MSKNFQKLSKKRVNGGETYFKDPDRKVTRLESVRENMFKFLVNPKNKIIHGFVLLNEKNIFDQIDRKLVDIFQILGKKGFNCLLLFILF